MTAKITYNRPFLYPYQEQIVDSPARFTFTEASTKVGKTASHIVWLHEQAFGIKDYKNNIIEPLPRNANVWWIAPVYKQAEIAFLRLKNQLSIRDVYKFNESKLRITTPVNTHLSFVSAERPDNLYGEDVFAFVFDEFPRAREAAWHALRSTITSTGGKGKFIGNVKGSKNWGHKLAMRAKSGETDMAYFKITAYDAAEAGMMTKDGRPLIEEIRAAKRDLPENVFKELYLAEATDEGSNPFNLRSIKLCTEEISAQPAICYGVDLAKSFDYTVEIGLDKTGAVCHFERYQRDWRHTTAAVKALGKPMAIDSTGVGDPIGEDVAAAIPDVELFKFTELSRQQLLEGLAVAIQKRLITFPEGRITYELEQFEYVFTHSGVRYRAPEGEHDDCVMALALAWHRWKTAINMSTGPSIW